MSVQRPNPRRADERGRAYKGSQRQIQRYVNECPVRLNRAILACVPSLATPAPQVTWVSPLDEKRCAEYSDRDFLEHLGLAELWPALRQFWPSRGPVWDGLARLRWGHERGVLLVEAKSYPEECRSACRASPQSLATIQNAIRQTQHAFCASSSRAWLHEYYQLANRLAHLHFLRQQGVHAWLVLLLLTDDWKKTPQTLWEQELSTVWVSLGLRAEHPWIGRVFLSVPGEGAKTLIPERSSLMSVSH